MFRYTQAWRSKVLPKSLSLLTYYQDQRIRVQRSNNTVHIQKDQIHSSLKIKSNYKKQKSVDETVAAGKTVQESYAIVLSGKVSKGESDKQSTSMSVFES